jgi:hypothetical protein
MPPKLYFFHNHGLGEQRWHRARKCYLSCSPTDLPADRYLGCSVFTFVPFFVDDPLRFKLGQGPERAWWAREAASVLV